LGSQEGIILFKLELLKSKGNITSTDFIFHKLNSNQSSIIGKPLDYLIFERKKKIILFYLFSLFPSI